MISVKNLSKTYRVQKKKEGLGESIKALFKRDYRNIEAVKNISFEISQGELVGFIGPNGAGKTTTLKMLSGILHPTSGEIIIDKFVPYKREENYLRQISLVMGQKNQLWWDLPAIETLSLNKEIYEIDDKKYQKTVAELSELLEIKEALEQPVRNLSLGQRMKCELMAALIHNPKILFLDEPTIGLDVVMQKKVREFIKDYNQKYMATVILTSHYMDDVKEICNRVIMINHGQIVFDGKINDLVKKYANHKTLIPVFNSKVDIEDLKRIGTVVEFSFPKAIINVPADQVSQKAADLLRLFDIDDLDINEPELEDIVALLFKKKRA